MILPNVILISSSISGWCGGKRRISNINKPIPSKALTVAKLILNSKLEAGRKTLVSNTLIATLWAALSIFSSIKWFFSTICCSAIPATAKVVERIKWANTCQVLRRVFGRVSTQCMLFVAVTTVIMKMLFPEYSSKCIHWNNFLLLPTQPSFLQLSYFYFPWELLFGLLYLPS